MSISQASPAELVDKILQMVAVSSWTTLDQTRINEFAHCTNDHQWIHVDVDRAKKDSPTRNTIAHGYLTLSLLASTMFEAVVPLIKAKQFLNYGLERVRFLAPVPSGSRVRNRIKVIGLEDKTGGRWLLTLENTVEIEGSDKPALIATTLAMLITN